jgi:hypothetical protein
MLGTIFYLTCYEGPFGTILLVDLQQFQVFGRVPFGLIQFGIQVVTPSFSTFVRSLENPMFNK